MAVIGKFMGTLVDRNHTFVVIVRKGLDIAMPILVPWPEVLL